MIGVDVRAELEKMINGLRMLVDHSTF